MRMFCMCMYNTSSILIRSKTTIFVNLTIFCNYNRQINKHEGQSMCSEFDGLFFECTAAEEYECVENIFHGLVYSIQKHRGERHMTIPPPLFIAEERHPGQKVRPRSPRNGNEKKDDKSPNKKNPTSFKLFNKSFKIFN